MLLFGLAFYCFLASSFLYGPPTIKGQTEENALVSPRWLLSYIESTLTQHVANDNRVTDDLLLLVDVQQQSVGIKHDTVRGVRDNGGNLASDLDLSELNETGLVLDGC